MFRVTCTIVNEDNKTNAYKFRGDTEKEAVDKAINFVNMIQIFDEKLQANFILEVSFWKKQIFNNDSMETLCK